MTNWNEEALRILANQPEGLSEENLEKNAAIQINELTTLPDLNGVEVECLTSDGLGVISPLTDRPYVAGYTHVFGKIICRIAPLVEAKSDAMEYVVAEWWAYSDEESAGRDAYEYFARNGYEHQVPEYYQKYENLDLQKYGDEFEGNIGRYRFSVARCINFRVSPTILIIRNRVSRALSHPTSAPARRGAPRKATPGTEQVKKAYEDYASQSKGRQKLEEAARFIFRNKEHYPLALETLWPDGDFPEDDEDYGKAAAAIRKFRKLKPLEKTENIPLEET